MPRRLHAPVAARMDHGDPLLDQLRKPRRLAQVFIQLEVAQDVAERPGGAGGRLRLEAEGFVLHPGDALLVLGLRVG